MRSLALLSLFCFLGISSLGFSDEYVRDLRSLDTNNNGIYEPGEVDPCKEYQTGPCTCYCPVTRFKEKKYCTKRMVQEPYQVQKRCCRPVKKYFKKRCCRYVPKYYTVYYSKRICKKCPEYYDQYYCQEVPEYYYNCETRYRNRCVTDENCCYEPYTCIEKRSCEIPPDCPQQQCPSCPSN